MIWLSRDRRRFRYAWKLRWPENCPRGTSLCLGHYCPETLSGPLPMPGFQGCATRSPAIGLESLFRSPRQLNKLL